VRRTARSLCCSTVLALLVLAGCGEGDEDEPTAASPEVQTTESPGSPAATESPSPTAPAEGCTPPRRDVEYTTGEASLDVTAGPDTGHYDLVLDENMGGDYAASDKEITGRWVSADEKAVLFIDIEGADPCVPDAFTSIGTRGAGGPLFIDSSHTACTVELTSLGDDGAAGTFSCSGLTGGGEGLERDAEGTFTLAP
jgi:hypothetical protein